MSVAGNASVHGSRGTPKRTITALTLCIALIPVKTFSSIPPPQTFTPAKSPAGKSAAVKVVSASDTVFKGQSQHPAGSMFVTDGYCSVVLDMFSGPGANILVNVMGSSDPSPTSDEWVPETKPIELLNATTAALWTSAVVPLRHDYTKFFLSKSNTPGVPLLAGSVGGNVLVFATAVPCLAGTPAW